MRIFEKITFKQFKNDICNNEKLYEEYNLPKRSTKNSAGYDIFSIEDLVINPGEIKKIPTGIKASMNNNEALIIIVRSSMGFKYNVRLTNQVGLIDSDYYNNETNEGHIYISLQNEGNKEYKINKGQAIAQGIFINYLTVDNEEKIDNKRNGGIGSTDGDING